MHWMAWSNGSVNGEMRALHVMMQLLAISAGASMGACLRWGLGLLLNALFPAIPPGTLSANLLGGYLIGVATGVLGLYVDLAPEWRLFVITGFLGGLTTFSTFSVEVVSLIPQGSDCGRLRPSGCTWWAPFS